LYIDELANNTEWTDVGEGLQQNWFMMLS